jgi:hypothetical protein
MLALLHIFRLLRVTSFASNYIFLGKIHAIKPKIDNQNIATYNLVLADAIFSKFFRSTQAMVAPRGPPKAKSHGCFFPPKMSTMVNRVIREFYEDVATEANVSEDISGEGNMFKIPL